MDNLGAANGRPPLSLNQQRNSGATTATPNYIDLTADDDDELMELTPAQMQLAMAGKTNRMETDTLDVSKLNYSFKMMQRKTELLPLRKQFIHINVFLRSLDEANRNYEFTHAQYRRAWGHAVKMHENEFAINHILATNAGLDKAGIEVVFTREIQDMVDEAYRVNVSTAYERALYLHGKASKTLEDALQRGDEKKIRSTMRRLVKHENNFGIVRDPALNVLARRPNLSRMAHPAPNNGRKPRRRSDRIVLSGRVSRPKVEKTKPAKKESSEQRDNMNLLPMTFNLLGNRVVKEPTPEKEVDDLLGLEAWKARQSMAMIPASAPGQPFAPQMAPAPQQENLKLNLISSSNYYVPSNQDTQLLESQDEHMKFYG